MVIGRSRLAFAIVSSVFALAGMVGSSLQAMARPADMFQQRMEQIRQELPPGYTIRLPNEILLGGPGHLQPSDLIVRTFPSSSPQRYTISLFTCESGPYPCLVGSFSTESASSTNAQQELSRHQAMQTPITLADGVQGYLREGDRLNPPSDFSSVMWQQDNMIYTVSFLVDERQNLIDMARSMAIQPPIYSLQLATP